MTTTQLTRINSGKKYSKVDAFNDLGIKDLCHLFIGLAGVVCLCVALCYLVAK